MEDINDFIDGGNPLTADQFNQMATEVQTVIEKSDQTLSAGTLNQLMRGIQDLSLHSAFYDCKGTGNAYDLSVAAIDLNELPTTLQTGMRFRFLPNFNNAAGTVTIQVGALGDKFVSSSAISATGDTYVKDTFNKESYVDVIYNGTIFYLIPPQMTFYVEDVGGANTHSLVGNFPHTLVDGMTFRYKVKTNCAAGTVTVAAGNVSATSLKRNAGGTNPITFLANELVAGFYLEIMYTSDNSTFTLIQNNEPTDSLTDGFGSQTASGIAIKSLNTANVASDTNIAHHTALNGVAVTQENLGEFTNENLTDNQNIKNTFEQLGVTIDTLGILNPLSETSLSGSTTNEIASIGVGSDRFILLINNMTVSATTSNQQLGIKFNTSSSNYAGYSDNQLGTDRDTWLPGTSDGVAWLIPTDDGSIISGRIEFCRVGSGAAGRWIVHSAMIDSDNDTHYVATGTIDNAGSFLRLGLYNPSTGVLVAGDDIDSGTYRRFSF